MFQLNKIGDNGEFIKTCDKIVIIYKTAPETYWVACPFINLSEALPSFGACVSVRSPHYFIIRGGKCGEYVYDGDTIHLEPIDVRHKNAIYFQISVDNNCC